MQYRDPVVQKYLDLIKNNTSGIKGFYNGLVDKIPESLLPAVIITIETTEANQISNVEDEHKINLNLIYVADIRQTLNDSVFVNGFNNVIDALVGRYTTGTPYALKGSSILNILRNNLELDTSNNLRTDVGSFSVATPSQIAQRWAGWYNVEGSIRFQANFIQTR
jgi:hypothetical protein